MTDDTIDELLGPFTRDLAALPLTDAERLQMAREVRAEAFVRVKAYLVDGFATFLVGLVDGTGDDADDDDEPAPVVEAPEPQPIQPGGQPPQVL